jgi:PPK2 family polyphosphate:nucleotide phosphotransferase
VTASKAHDRLSERLRISPGNRLLLRKFDADETYGWVREEAEAEQAQFESKLTDLQERMWAEGKRSLLIVLQGIDAAGKDGTIRHVMDAFNPQGCRVVGFKAPTPEELRHDFLWRIHPHTPAKGSVTIFNRSHYEDVLVVRVHGLVPKGVWRDRYRSINEFERMLAEEGTTILKFFLYIDRDEQRERLQARLDDPDKRWKFSSGDLPEREKWDEYIEAFQDAITRTSTDWAPWYLIPANRKWFRNLAVAHVLGETLEALDPKYPPAEPGIADIVIPK